MGEEIPAWERERALGTAHGLASTRVDRPCTAGTRDRYTTAWGTARTHPG